MTGDGLGVLLLNQGEPRTPDETVQFLQSWFLDPYQLRLPLGRLYQAPLSRWVARRRAPEIAAQIKAIHLEREGDGAVAVARELSMRLGLPVARALRYGSPRVPEVLEYLLRQDVGRLALLSLHPHFSYALTGSLLADFWRYRPRWLPAVLIERHGLHPGYIQALAAGIQDTKRRAESGLLTQILLTAPSLPVRFNRKGDAYLEQVRSTAAVLTEALDEPLPPVLAFQTRFGSWRWQGPALEEVLETFVVRGVRQLIVCPIGTVTESWETRYGLDFLFRRQCFQAGIRHMLRVPAIGVSDIYLDALADMVQASLCHGAEPRG